MEEKKKSGSKIIVVLLVLVVLALVGYIVYDKVLGGNNTIDTSVADKKDYVLEKKSEVEVLETTDELVTNLIGKITNVMDCENFRDIFLTDGVFKGTDFSNQQIYSLALRSIYSEVSQDTSAGVQYKDFSSERLEKEIASIVGKDYKFTHESYISCPAWDYDANTKSYKAPTGSACGCTTGPYHTMTRTTKAFKNGGKIEIYQRVIFVDTITGKGYSDSKKTNEITDLVRLGGMYEDAIDDSNDANYTKGALYKLVFEEEDGNYIFVSSEPVTK